MKLQDKPVLVQVQYSNVVKPEHIVRSLNVIENDYNMPAGHGDTFEYINGIKVDKANDVCFFNDEAHKYYNKSNMKTYISCTTIVHEYCQPFNADF